VCVKFSNNARVKCYGIYRDEHLSALYTCFDEQQVPQLLASATAGQTRLVLRGELSRFLGLVLRDLGGGATKLGF